MTITGINKDALANIAASMTIVDSDGTKKSLVDGCVIENVEEGSIIIHLKIKDNAAKERFEKALQDGSINILLGNLLRGSGVPIGDMQIRYTYPEKLDEFAQTQGKSSFY